MHGEPDLNPYTSPEGDFAADGPAQFVSDSETQSRRLRLTLFICIYALVAASGLVPLAAHSPAGTLLRVLVAVLLPSAMTGWCVTDARILGKPILHSLYLIIFFTWPVAVPIYLIKSRGRRGVGLALLNAFGLLGAIGLAPFAAHFAVYAQMLVFGGR